MRGWPRLVVRLVETKNWLLKEEKEKNEDELAEDVIWLVEIFGR